MKPNLTNIKAKNISNDENQNR